jgi:hypothetical protein
MNMLQKQTELGRSLFQINSSTLRSYAELQRANMTKYVELNTSYGKQLPSVNNVQDFMALQREYGQSVWSGVKSSVESQTSLVRSAFQETGAALKTAYTAAEAKAPVETKAPAAKAPVEAKAPAAKAAVEEKAPAKKTKA